MAPSIDTVLQTMFESEVKQAYQEIGGLANSVKVKNAKGSQIVKFPKLGKSQAKVRNNISTPLTTDDTAYSQASVTMVDFYDTRLTDIFKSNQVAFEERSELIKMMMPAMQRKRDQLVIDALEAASVAKGVATNISGSADNLTLAALRDAARQLDVDGVPDDGRGLLIHVNGLHHLLADTTVTSADYNNIQALIKGDLNTFYGFDIIKIGTRAEGGLNINGSSERKNFAFHRDSVGLGVNLEVQTHVDWEPSYGAHRVSMFASANAVVIDADGVVEITTDES